MKKNRLSIVVVAIAAIFLVAGCAPTVKKEEAIQKAAEPAVAPAPKVEEKAKEEVSPPPEEKVAEQPIKEEAAEAVKKAPPAVKDELTELVAREGRLFTIYFDFDRFTIKDDMKPILEKDAEWLKKNNSIKIQIQGHCDERGTNEYNIALGERRAQSIKGYLANYGIDEKRLSTISYGEERPVDPDHTEEAWAKNRRGELMIKK